MALINWHDSISVKMQQFDQHHKIILDMINELDDAMKIGKSKDVLGNIVDSLLIYTETHFKTEEEYFEKFAYPDIANHKKEHDVFVQKIIDFKNGFEKNKLSLSFEVMSFLRDWLESHIMGTDKKYTRFFKEKGLK